MKYYGTADLYKRKIDQAYIDDSLYAEGDSAEEVRNSLDAQISGYLFGDLELGDFFMANVRILPMV